MRPTLRLRPISATLVGVTLASVAASCAGGEIFGVNAAPSAMGPRLSVVQGAGQVAEVGTTLPTPVAVRVTDARNRDTPIRNQLLLWIVSKGAGRVDSDTTRSDAEGISRQRWTLGTVATDDSLEIWLIAPDRHGIANVSIGALALHGPPLAGGQQCDPITFSLSANVAVPIVDSIRVYARDRYNNFWPYDAPVAMQDVQFSGSITGQVKPAASFTSRTVTLAPSTYSRVGDSTSWQGGWLLTLNLGGPDHSSCTVGASSR